VAFGPHSKTHQNKPKRKEKKMTKSIFEIVNENVSLYRIYKDVKANPWLPNSWYWLHGELYTNEGHKFLSAEQISEFCSASCMPDLWAMRAWADMLGISVKKADWFYYQVRKSILR
jgi:hypothetical protein